MRVFLGLTEVSGFYSNLKRGFDAIGVHADLVSLNPHRFGYQDRQQLLVPAFAQYCVVKRMSNQRRGIVLRAFWFVMVGISRAALLLWAIARYDAFVFCCATSFFRYRELPFLRLLGKRIIYNFHGTDGRMGFMDGFAENSSMPQHLRASSGYIGYIENDTPDEERTHKLRAYVEVTRLRHKNVLKIDRFADVIINSPSHGQYHTRPFVQRLIVGIPYHFDSETLGPVLGSTRAGEIVILHSPSYPEGKGTPGIRSAIATLTEKGYPIRFVEISGKPNREVLAELAKCDFVIDQLYSDMPMVGFATEAAFFGKPAIVGGYYSEEIGGDIAAKWIPPSLFCLPENIESAIEKLITDLEFRESLGKRAREFVERNWSAAEVAKRVVALIDGNFPKEWLFDPSECRYIYGMGMSKKRLHRIITGILDYYGPEAFRLEDKPLLLERILNFAAKPVGET